MRAGRIAAAVVCLLGGGCVPAAGGGSRSIDVGEAALDRAHPEVVWLSSECSGTLVDPRHVLTAAHCVVGIDALPTVRVSGDWDETFFAVGCRAHPNAFGEPTACLDPDRDDLDWAHDLALLRLGRPVPERLARPTTPWLVPRPGDWWHDRAVELVGWTRRPSLVGAPRRYAGWNRIALARDGIFATVPRGGARRFTTAPGQSGGPALVRVHGRSYAAGILTGAEAPVSPTSGYAILSERANSTWLRRQLTPPPSRGGPGGVGGALAARACGRAGGGARVPGPLEGDARGG